MLEIERKTRRVCFVGHTLVHSQFSCKPTRFFVALLELECLVTPRMSVVGLHKKIMYVCNLVTGHGCSTQFAFRRLGNVVCVVASTSSSGTHFPSQRIKGVSSHALLTPGSGLCPSGTAWVDYATGDNVAHAVLTECSNMGICDRATVRCLCRTGFSGEACQRMECPNDCNGQGRYNKR